MSRSPPSLALYRLATAALAPAAPLLLRQRAAGGREDQARLGERLGRASRPRPAGTLAWLHGVSVGESLSLLALARRIRAARPQASILLTSATPAAAQVLAVQAGEGMVHQYAPLDTPGAARRFIDNWRPDLAVFAESELWPNLILAARAGGSRLALVSARLSEASARRWDLAPATLRHLFSAFDLILARDGPSAGRLAGLGAAVAGVADLKFAADPLPCDAAALRLERQRLAGRPLILAASTHAGEEAAILAAFSAVAAATEGSALLVIAPRHPARGPQIADMAARLGLACARRADGGSLGQTAVHVADTVGEMGLWYRLAALALVGGSLAPDVGGHNPLEAARLDCPLLVGPFTGNWPLYDELAAAGAVRRLGAPGELSTALAAGLSAPKACEAMSRAAREWVQVRDSATLAALDRIVGLLP